MDGHFKCGGILGHLKRVDSLAAVEPCRVRDEALDDHDAALVKNPCDVAEACRLPIRAEKAENCVEYTVDQLERPLRWHIGDVTDRDGGWRRRPAWPAAGPPSPMKPLPLPP